jgi:hypothetical protein
MIVEDAGKRGFKKLGERPYKDAAHPLVNKSPSSKGGRIARGLEIGYATPLKLQPPSKGFHSEPSK